MENRLALKMYIKEERCLVLFCYNATLVYSHFLPLFIYTFSKNVSKLCSRNPKGLCVFSLQQQHKILSCSLLELLLWMCDQSTVSSLQPCRTDLGFEPAAVSRVVVAVGWYDRQGCAHRLRKTIPASLVPCPNWYSTPHTSIMTISSWPSSHMQPDTNSLGM